MTLDQIGQKLKSARDVSGLSLAQIQEKTKIPYNHLASIDAGNFDDLPEPVYVSGFIRRYAECVGLEAQELVEEYRNEIDANASEEKKSGFIFKHQKTFDSPTAAQVNYYNRRQIDASVPNLFKLIPFYALWIVLILGLILYLVKRQSEIEQSQDTSLLTMKQTDLTNSKTKSSGITDASGPQLNTISPDEGATETPGLYHVAIKSNSHVWVEVKAASNGESLFNGFFEPGEKRDFSDKEGFRITATNGKISVLAQDKTTEFGSAGRTTEKIFMGKANQTVKSEAKEQTKSSSGMPDATHASSSNVSSTSPVVSKKTSTDTGIALNKKVPVNTPATKMPLIKPSLPINHELPENNNEPLPAAPINKAIDVPYRYSE